ncbi:MAG: aminoglycoside 6-adenylyltransferase [Anaerolineales bacterium]|nr:aminoglycoside 6-adenylyltransferase [Anaerolineales bacterium]
MRSEREMFDLILDTARADDRIRAVILNGSRADPGVKRDIFQDYDIVYLVTEVASFRQDPAWIDCFGERMILQTPDDMGDSPRRSDSYAYLMQFADGNRIDLTLYPVNKLGAMERDSLSVLLLDKDGIVKPFPPPSAADYAPKPPTAKAFADCCNEFWWVSPYVAKGLWRRQIPYARFMLDTGVRRELMKMLDWYVGVKTGFASGPGYCGKYLERHLEPDLWKMLLDTYADADIEQVWGALDAMGALFRIAAGKVAEHFGFVYPRGDDERVGAHLKRVRGLPADAGKIYGTRAGVRGAGMGSADPMGFGKNSMTGKQAVLDRVRVINKHVTNKILIRIAGKSFGHFAVLTHTGRKSGKQYRIPIIAEPVENGFIFALTYGKKVDWAANVFAAGGCSLLWKNTDFPLRNPEFIDREIGLLAFPSFLRAALRAARIQYFLRLSR